MAVAGGGGGAGEALRAAAALAVVAATLAALAAVRGWRLALKRRGRLWPRAGRRRGGRNWAKAGEAGGAARGGGVKALVVLGSGGHTAEMLHLVRPGSGWRRRRRRRRCAASESSLTGRGVGARVERLQPASRRRRGGTRARARARRTD